MVELINKTRTRQPCDGISTASESDDGRHERNIRRKNQISQKTNLLFFIFLLAPLPSIITASKIPTFIIPKPGDDDVKGSKSNSSKSNNLTPNLSALRNALFGGKVGFFDNSVPQGGGFMLHPSPAGPIADDATCDVKRLEEANDSQLHSILVDLINTAFFRTYLVDLDLGCPLGEWAGVVKDGKKKKKKASTKPEREEKEKEEVKCASEGLPDVDPDAEPACSVQGGGISDSPFGQEGFLSSVSSFSNSNSKSSVQETSFLENEKEEEEGSCSGGESADLDEGAPPLCTVTSEGADDTSPFGATEPQTSSLKSISQRPGGWESEDEEQTFSWSQTTDPVVVSEEQPCDEDGSPSLPDTFWVDMCSKIRMGDGSTMVNLALNPERNTGYNGTHIWKAIYEENCINLDRSSDTRCYEERVLYRLLSGLHASTTLSIAKNYYPPSKRKGRKEWESNPEFFMEKFGSNPDYIRNLHFSYVVLLRALRKARPVLHSYAIHTGNSIEDETASILLKRLLDSSILRSCQDVFTAFDESLMFREDASTSLDVNRDNRFSLQENFKGVFHNISSVLDCVQCQQCKLHGKMTMMGYGAALKILFLPSDELIASSLTRNEIVAFINTIAKMSNSLTEIRDLTTEYWARQISTNDTPTTATVSQLPSPEPGKHDAREQTEKKTEESPNQHSLLESIDLIDAAVGAVSNLAKTGKIDQDRESDLVRMAFEREPDLLILAKYYGSDLDKFLKFSQNIRSKTTVVKVVEKHEEVFSGFGEPDAIVVGSGLAGLAAALNILDRGGKVIVVEKEHRLGGNSNKASSGINAWISEEDMKDPTTDHKAIFRNDTIRSAGDAAQLPLIDILVEHSPNIIHWLKDRVGVDLSLLAQLGGHSEKRTHRPSNGMAGAEIIYGMQKEVKKFQDSGNVKILVDTKVTSLLKSEEDDGVIVNGVEVICTSTKEGGCVDGITTTATKKLFAPNVILATGGFASDRSKGSYLAQYRPELMKMPATAGDFSTGDGIALATSLGAGTVDMDKIQIHPTGWVDPSDPNHPSKVLAAELMRGVGGILINNEGKRFCNELGTRAYVTNMMLRHDQHFAATGEWNANAEAIPTFSLVLSSAAAKDGKKHVDLYKHKGLLQELVGVTSLAAWMNVSVSTVQSSLEQYQQDAKNGVDQWGKTVFRGIPSTDLDNEVFYAGTVVPVLHYCMGGITIDTEGNVLDGSGRAIPGLHGAGEVTGGVHGNNRLGGNSLLECAVFGTIVGKKIPVQEREKPTEVSEGEEFQQQNNSDNVRVTVEELAKHNTPEDCWVALDGQVYDMTEFAEEHPPGAESIHELAGTDGTEAFNAVHNVGMLEDFDDVKIGALVES